MGYAIKDGYVENPRVCYFLDDVTATRGLVFQPDVYTFAEWVTELAGVGSIIDIGCGWGDKLARIQERHLDWQFMGIDFGDNIRHCRSIYSWGTWGDIDIEAADFFIEAEGAVIICSDVIEHVADPRPLVRAMASSGATAIIISTPERDLQWGADHNGPPPNLCHIREWNGVELAAFLTAEGLIVRHVGLTRVHDQSAAMATQLVVVTP